MFLPESRKFDYVSASVCTGDLIPWGNSVEKWNRETIFYRVCVCVMSHSLVHILTSISHRSLSDVLV